MSPIVGISQCLDERGRWRAGRDYVYIDRAYADAVVDAGGTPLHLPPQPDAAAVVARIDALLLPGGDDFLPDAGTDSQRYPRDVFDPAPAAGVDFDTRLLAAALARGLPVLGICYGMQLIALHHGGSLHHHLPIDCPEADEHRLPEAARHAIEVQAGSRLEAILGPGPRVNSRHHQAVALPGTGMSVSARGADGIIEAIESEDDRFLVGVQWHPEKLDRSESGRTALFRALVEAAAS